MKTNSQKFPYAVLIGALVSGFGMAADTTGVATSSSTTQTNVTTQNTSVRSAQEMKWTELKGKVTHVDLQTNVIQIREAKSDTLLEIPVTSDVSIQKNDHHAYALGDLKEGDKVVIRNNRS